MRIPTPAFFCFPFAWNIFFLPLTFSPYVSLGLKWISCKQDTYGSCFLFIQPVFVLWLENLLHLHLIIDISDPITIFLIGIDFVDLFPSFVFFDHVHPFKICCKAGLVVLSLLNFYLSENLFISLSALNEIPAGYDNLACRFFPFQYFKYILPFPSGLKSFCWKISC